MDDIQKYKLNMTTINKLLNEYAGGINTNNLENINFLLGRNAASNWYIYHNSDQSDTIFHLDKFSSPYVIVNLPIDQLTREQILVASIICKKKSKYKNVPEIGILYTSVSNTRLGESLGTFIIKSNNKKKLIYI